MLTQSHSKRIRWHIKKIARKLMILSTFVPQYRVGLRGATRIRVITYHRFGNIPYNPFCISADQFEQQMKWLAENKLSVSLSQLLDFIDGKITGIHNAVLVTIDDGYKSTHDVALPILKKYNLPSVIFVSSGSLDGSLKSDLTNEPYMCIDELKCCRKGNMEIGSHAHSHRSVGKLDLQDAKKEICESKNIIENRLDEKIRSFAYPFGTVKDFNSDTMQFLRECEYTTAFTSTHGSIQKGMYKLSLPRVKIESGESLFWFKLICKGGMDAWRFIDSSLFHLQTPINN